MDQSAEARPGCSQGSKMNLSVRIVNIFKLTLLFLPKVLSWMSEAPWLHLWHVLTQLIVSQSMNRKSSFDAYRYVNIIKIFKYVDVHDSI